MEYASEESPAWGDLKLIAGLANPELANLISQELGVPLTDPNFKQFSDGEFHVTIQDSMRGHDVFVIQPTCHPVNENWMELFILLDALRRASAGRITAVIPYYGYARQERKTQPREPITAKLMANIVTLAGADRALLLDLHADAAEGFFDVPTDHLKSSKLFADHIKSLGLSHITVVSPDAGGAKRAAEVAAQLGAPQAFGYKRRQSDGDTEVLAIAGDVADRNIVVVEDQISSGTTAVTLAKELRRQGARKIYFLATHAVLTPGAVERLRESPIDEVIVTNTIPIPPEKRGAPITILSVAPLLAEAISRVHWNRSVSELFKH